MILATLFNDGKANKRKNQQGMNVNSQSNIRIGRNEGGEIRLGINRSVNLRFKMYIMDSGYNG